MNDVDVASIEDMLNTEAGLGAAGLGGLLIPAPPLTLLRHRDPRLLCRLGTRSYCPGEILFRCRGNAGHMLNIIASKPKMTCIKLLSLPTVSTSNI